MAEPAILTCSVLGRRVRGRVSCGMASPARILIVDDMPENLDILSGLLEPEGYHVETARDGQEAVERALAEPPDLILMDVSMPRLTGLEACRQLKGDPRTQLVPILLITGLRSEEHTS